MSSKEQFLNLSCQLLAYECANLNDFYHRPALKGEKQIVQT